MNVSRASIVICTYNRARLLRETLAAVQAMTPPPSCAVEIVVVDNNSTDDTPAVIAEAGNRGPFPIVSLKERQQGKSFALNLALAHATGDVLALTDDDVLPSPDWIERIVEAFRTQPVTFVFGKVLPRWSQVPPPELLTPRAQDIWGPLAIVDYGDTPTAYPAGTTNQRLPVGANLSFARAALVAIDGWRTDLGKVDNTLLSGEDHEIFMRLRRWGLYAGVYDPRITVRHYVPPERLTRRYFRRWFFWHGKTQALMLDDLYPELDMSRVPRIAGVPRFACRQAWQQCRRWMRTLGRNDAMSTLIEELRLFQYVGLFVQCWDRRRLLPRQAPRERSSLGPSVVRASVRAMLRQFFFGIALTLFGASIGTAADRVTLAIRDGRAWLAADDAPLAQILAEWGRVGQTRIVNGDRVDGTVTLRLDGVPEDQALTLLLRSAAGFITVPRPAAGAEPSSSRSRFESVFILPVGGRTANTAAGPVYALPPFASTTPSAPSSAGQRLIGLDGLPVPEDQEDEPVGAASRPRPPGSIPPGFSPAPEPPRPPSGPPLPAATATPGMAPGVAVPGMTVPPVPEPSASGQPAAGTRRD